MKPVIVGTYDLGGEPVKLWLRPGTGGSCRGRGHEKMTRMEIGADHDDWSDIFEVALHEATEFVGVRLGCQYSPFVDYSQDMTARLIVQTHAQHSEICARAGAFLADCYDDLKAAWKRWKKDQR